MAVCTYCRSTLLREGEALRRIGRSAELFDDHSPLRLGVQGRFQGEAFALVGRVQLAYLDLDGRQGRWTEWQALFDSGRRGTLSEDNGGHVFTFPVMLQEPLPQALEVGPPGSEVMLGGQRWSLAARVVTQVHAMEGELLSRPNLSSRQTVVELRNTVGEVMSVVASSQPPVAEVGRSVQLEALHLGGTFDPQGSAQARVAALGMACPNCGVPLQPTLANTRSIVCGSCRAVVDVSRGLGADLAWFRQDNALDPLIPLGRTGQIKVWGRMAAWQVVGYQERCEVDTDEAQSFWREYLLYHRSRGFAFLVDAEDGWSVVAPVTGVPKGAGERVTFEGRSYQKRYSYVGRTTCVLGEFYWPVQRDQRSIHTDYLCRSGGVSHMLNREQTAQEVTWSAGEAIDHLAVMKAFGIPSRQVQAFQRDVTPISSWWRSGLQDNMVALIVFALVLLLFVLPSCSDACGEVKDRYGASSPEYQQCRAREDSGGGSSGSWGSSHGGYNSGGFHK